MRFVAARQVVAQTLRRVTLLPWPEAGRWRAMDFAAARYCSRMVQHTVDWDARYRAGDTPWEDETVAPSVSELVLAHSRPGAHVLEIGCGYGTNSLWLAQQGYRVTACDVSPNALRVVGERARDAGVDVIMVVADALAVVSELPAAEVVFTRGVLHTFITDEGRARFAAAVASCLPAAGLWLDISGSADTPDDPVERVRLGFPRLSASELVAAVEPHFEIQSIRRVTYGVSPGRTNFLAWASCLRRRS
jgi:methyl halide transferase